jgi:uncharacterized OB-fold protein
MAYSIQPVLYIDTQGEIPAGYCEKCGGALYRESLRCIRCRQEEL